MPVHLELLGRDEQRAGRAQGDVASAISHHAGAHSGGGVVPRPGADYSVPGDPQRVRHLRLDRADGRKALEQLWQLCFRNTANLQHLSAPALVLHIQEQRAGGVGIVGGVDPGENVVHIVLGEHDFLDLMIIFRLVLPHPQELRRGEAGEGDVGGQGGEFFPAQPVVQLFHLFCRAPIVPQDGGTDHLIVFVQHHQPMHLAGAADPRHVPAVASPQQFGDPLQEGPSPVLGVLLTPARVGRAQRIVLRDYIADVPFCVHQQQLHGRGAKINTNIIVQCLFLPVTINLPLFLAAVHRPRYLVGCGRSNSLRQRLHLALLLGLFAVHQALPSRFTWRTFFYRYAFRSHSKGLYCAFP